MTLRALLAEPAHFYPRPPRGGRPWLVSGDVFAVVFLSTPSARRATQDHPRHPDHRKISIHALREEGDQVSTEQLPAMQYFYPRPPRGGRPAPMCRSRPCAPISIHALREEGDGRSSPTESTGSNFYPRPPRGGRQQKQRQNLYFQTNYTTFCTNLEEP